MQSLVSVVRGPPRDRGKVEGLAGRLFVTIRVSSRATGDGADSYLHVGSGLQRIVVDEEELRKRASGAKNRAELEKLVQELSGKIELDYAELVMVGGKPVIPGSSVKGNVRSRIELSLKPKNGKIRS
ncbi:RAMP superfamily CRISPR-associated protein, partial [Thermofilum sp.]|uniref:RAMP superfamily CRISPR-associated protein n=1 Tax=Thermofilum sp. TaxID=1961369 RepID=UPI00258B507D